MSTRLEAMWSRLRAPTAIAVVVTAVALSMVALGHGGWFMCNFRAFYCTAHVLAAGSDPYAVAPLYACESAPAPAPLFIASSGLVVPGPLPGYAIAALVPFAALSFPVATLAWFALLCGCMAASIVLLARLGVGNTWNIVVALSVALIGDALASGELEPIALLGIVLAAWGVSRSRASLGLDVVVGCGVALSFAEPQVGIAVAIACAMLGPRSAIAAVTATMFLGVVSIGALGIVRNIEFLHNVIPAHLTAELPSYSQFSLSWVLNRLGVAAGAAITAGRLQWLAMLVVAGWFARSKAAAQSPEVAVLGAPAFAVLGGPYSHLDQIALAIPAALWICSSYARVPRLVALAPVVLALPLMLLLMEGAASGLLVVALSALVAGWVGAEYGKNREFAVWCAALTVITLAGLAVLSVVAHAGVVSVSAPVVRAGTAQASWAHYIATHSVVTAWPIWLVKAPTWFGILATACGLIAFAVPRAARLPERAYG